MEARNATFNNVGTIDCEIDHPVWGWIPFTASPDDPEESGRAMFAALKDSASAYVAPAEAESAEATDTTGASA